MTYSTLDRRFKLARRRRFEEGTVATEDCSGRPDLVNDNPSNTGGVPGSPAKSFKIISKVSLSRSRGMFEILKVRGFVDFFFVLA
jgi:hypothetical protein